MSEREKMSADESAWWVALGVLYDVLSALTYLM